MIVIEDMFYEGYDIRVKLSSEDRLNPLASLCGAQVLGTTGEAFGTIYGNGSSWWTTLWAVCRITAPARVSCSCTP